MATFPIDIITIRTLKKIMMYFQNFVWYCSLNDPRLLLMLKFHCSDEHRAVRVLNDKDRTPYFNKVLAILSILSYRSIRTPSAPAFTTLLKNSLSRVNIILFSMRVPFLKCYYLMYLSCTMYRNRRSLVSEQCLLT